MKTLTKGRALRILRSRKDRFRALIEDGFERNSKDCGACEVQGACCTDDHFVNVHVTRLDGEAIAKAVQDLAPELRSRVLERSAEAVERYDLKPDAASFTQTYSCPLYEKEAGCLVHETAKPAACIHHACYENPADLPPQALLDEEEADIGLLNTLVYKNAWSWQPIPLWLNEIGKQDR